MEPLKDIAMRIKGLREMSDISTKEMAEFNHMSEDKYKELEEGQSDFSFTFLYNCA